LAVQPYLAILDSAEEVAASILRGEHDEFYPGFLMIGSNGGGEYIALDARSPTPP
jgi:hypothetical protein